MNVSVAGLDEIINESREAREVKRALCVKMVLGSMPVVQICEILNVSAPFVSKWRGLYEAQGAQSLALGYAGSEGYLTAEQKAEVIAWIQTQATAQQSAAGQTAEGQTVDVAAVRDYLEAHYQVVYKSPQSYYELLHEAGLSYHKIEKVNPQRDEAQVVERRAAIKKTGTALGGNKMRRDGGVTAR